MGRFGLSQWVEALRHGKGTYRLAELARLAGMSPVAARQAALRLRRRGWLARLGKGLYANRLAPLPPTLEDVAAILYPPAYISFESALFQHGVLDQAPHLLTCATLNKTKRFRTELGEIRYHRLKPELFFGHELQDSVPLASAEKALLDFVYLQLKQGRTPVLEELNVENVDLDRMEEWSAAYPRTVRRAIGRLRGVAVQGE